MCIRDRVATFLMGSQKVYDFVDDNPGALMMDVGYTNNEYVIAKNPKVTAINSALQIDLTGQICADSLGIKHYSGVGGQVDFVRGASLSKGGKAIIAIPSTTSKGLSRIAPVLMPGAGVVTTRAHMHWFVTEYGSVNLYGKSLQQRAKLIISVDVYKRQGKARSWDLMQYRFIWQRNITSLKLPGAIRHISPN